MVRVPASPGRAGLIVVGALFDTADARRITCDCAPAAQAEREEHPNEGHADRRGQGHADVAGRRAVQQLLRRDLPQRNPEHGLRADAGVVQALQDGRHEHLQPWTMPSDARSSGEFRLRKVFMKLASPRRLS